MPVKSQVYTMYHQLQLSSRYFLDCWATVSFLSSISFTGDYVFLFMTSFATVLTYWSSSKWQNEELIDMKASGKFNYQKIACIDGAIVWVRRPQRLVVSFMLATMIRQLCYSSLPLFGGSSAYYWDFGFSLYEIMYGN